MSSCDIRFVYWFNTYLKGTSYSRRMGRLFAAIAFEILSLTSVLTAIDAATMTKRSPVVPTADIKRSNDSLRQGEDIQFTCETPGSNASAVRWFKDGVLLPHAALRNVRISAKR